MFQICKRVPRITAISSLKLCNLHFGNLYVCIYSYVKIYLFAVYFKVRSLEQKKEMEDLVQQVEELERIRQKQAKKIANLKEEVEIQDQNSQEKRVVSDNAVHALSSELRTTKNALDVVTSREKTVRLL